MRIKKISRLSPAKVNLYLKILGSRPDGYHELLTLMHTIDLTDEVAVWEKGKSGILLESAHPQVPKDASNLMVKASLLFLEKAKIQTGLGLRLHKKIPVAAGLGGGSSNGAATLLALNELFDYPLQPNDLWDIACQLGSDVAFFLTGGTCLCRGRGEEVEKLAVSKPGHFVLVNPGVPLSTREVYQAFQMPAHFSLTQAKENLIIMIRIINERGFEALGAALSNDLEEPALRKMPALKDIKFKLAEAGLKHAIVSGSGSTVFGIAWDEKEAQEIRKKVCRLLPLQVEQCFVARSFEC